MTASATTLLCFDCGPAVGPKAICLFPPREMGKSRPRCAECLRRRNQQYTGRGEPGKVWRKNMQLHFR